MSTKLTKIKFLEEENSYGYQETENGKLIHLYDEEGDQLDSGNGYFPSKKWGNNWSF